MDMSRIKKKKKNSGNSDNDERLAKILKAFHNIYEGNDNLAKQRNEMEFIASLVNHSSKCTSTPIRVKDIDCEWTVPTFPHRDDLIILYCHGGGYTSGKIDYARVLSTRLSEHTGLKVFSFAYKLAPESPYPAAILDAMQIYNHLMHYGYGANQIIIVGDSAGGNLAIELLLHLKTQGRLLPRAMVLMSPWTDMRCVFPAYEKYMDKDPVLTRKYIEECRSLYAGELADFSLPDFSPVLADLSGFPPTLIQVGFNEILRSDSEELYAKLRKHKVNCHLEVYKGCWHVFQQYPIPKAQTALSSIYEFIKGI